MDVMGSQYMFCFVIAVICSTSTTPSQNRIEANKDFVHRFAAAVDAHHWDALDDLVASDIKRHSRSSG